MSLQRKILPLVAVVGTVLLPPPLAARADSDPVCLSPVALAASADGRTLFVACATANRVLAFDTAASQVTATIAMPAAPSGLALAADGTTLFVTCAAPESTVCVVDVSRGRILRKFPAGHTAQAPVLSRDGQTLFVCNRFNNEVAAFALPSGRLVATIPVTREPVAAALTPDGRWLLVANLLQNHAVTTGTNLSAVVSVIDVAARKVAKELTLPNGSEALLGLAVSPDGRLAAVTHDLARFNLPTTQLDRGWMNTSAVSLIDLTQLRVINTVLLDDVDAGAANPWAVAWTPDGTRLVVSHAGTHELSVIEVPRLLEKLSRLPEQLAPGQTPDYTHASNVRADVPNDLAFLVGLRRRLPLLGQGPRSLVVTGDRVWVGDYFSDALESVDLAAAPGAATLVPLGPTALLTPARRGEMFFNDATLCFQHWQSCATCHPGNARVDGLNWDLLNDGIGNPKNTKSLLLTFSTPPAMSLGVRETPEAAVRAGIRHILFAVQPEDVARALDAYLKSLKPVPSPHLDHGALSKAARRGKRLFESARVGCASCHPAKLFTDLQSYDVGTVGPFDKPTDRFDTPTLVESWRTAPYLHDGSAATVRDVVTTHNHGDQHGKTSQLTPQEIDDLVAYVLSL